MFETYYTGDYWLARFLMQRSLALLYLIAFVNALNQFRPLAGENGLMAARPFLNRISFKKAPGIFHFYYSDRFFGIICWTGILFSLVAVSGLSESISLPVSMLIWFLLWSLYQSIVNTGQIFYGFGWESMLLEFGFYAIFLGTSHTITPVLVIFIIRWMLFRVEFGAGLIKMRGDPCWRDLTCLSYHHETQPQPNPLSRYFHLLPAWIHKFETLFNHLVQLVIVWGLFFPQPIAAVSAVLIIISQLYLVISGNYSWLNWMTIVLAFSGFSDSILKTIVPLSPPSDLLNPAFWQFTLSLLGAVIIYLSINPVKNMISSSQRMNASFNPLHLVNTYGAFGAVTKKRYEIIIEGTTDTVIDETTQWKAYEFKGKPGNPARIPPVISPYHLRLDWQMWFAAMTSYHHQPWLKKMIYKFFEQDEAILNLLRNNPFPDEAPRYIRARLFHYRYSTRKERKQTGLWWQRTYTGLYMPILENPDRTSD